LSANKQHQSKTKNSAAISRRRSAKTGIIKGTQFIKFLELLHVLLVFLVIFLFLALVTYNPLEGPGSDTIGRSSGMLGQFGSSIASAVMLLTFGRYGAFAIPGVLLLILTGWWSKGRFKPLRWILGFIVLGFYTGFIIAYVRSLRYPGQENAELSGLLPLRLVEQSILYLQPAGTALVAITVALVLLIFLANLRLSRVLSFIFFDIPSVSWRIIRNLVTLISGKIKLLLKRRSTIKIKKRVTELLEQSEPTDESSNDLPDSKELSLDVPPKSVQQASISNIPFIIEDEGAVVQQAGERLLPPIRLLDQVLEDQSYTVQTEELEENAYRLEEKLRSLKINARVIKTVPGPVITRYDLEPAPEIKIARIANSADDIAMALAAQGVRILAPIPGESAVGVEIPNRNQATVYIREIVGSEQFRSLSSPLTIALGKDSSGDIYCTDLARMPHLLIAGATGSGKSVCINGIIASLLFRSDPKDVRLVLIDPKKLELSLYARLSEQHLVAPPGLGEQVITTPENAVKTLHSVLIEMGRRYDILAEAGVRGLDEYNKWIERTAPTKPDEQDIRERLPYLVVIIDELADLMMVVRREFEELVARLAQMSRAVGIHLIVATQRPSVDVVTGLIKANFPSRIAFQVASKFDSRTIIDIMGAESLLGRGDMLFQGPGVSQLIRLHCALVTTDEVERVVEFVRAQPPCESRFKLPDPEVERVRITSTGNTVSQPSDVDSLFEEAAKIVVRSEQGSISVLQRRLRVGYARAARLIDELEQAGIVGPFDGSKAREVLISPEELREIHGIG